MCRIFDKTSHFRTGIRPHESSLQTIPSQQISGKGGAQKEIADFVKSAMPRGGVIDVDINYEINICSVLP